MKNVIFAVPFSLENTMRFVRAVRTLPGVRLFGVVQTVPTGDDAKLFDDIAVVEDGLNAQQILDACRKIANRYGPIHRLLGILEPLQVQLAQVRGVLGLDGVKEKTAELFRDKAKMKDALRAAGLPCARHAVITTYGDAERFVGEVGLPVVLKPPAGMGCKATWRINTLDELKAAVHAIGASPQNPCLAEEFLRGREYSFETLTLGGEVRFVSATRYFPTPLEVMETPWIQWAVVMPRHIDTPEFDGVHKLGLDTIKALGLDTGMTHMEWFRRDDGSLAIGEIAARPPGAQIVLMNGFAHDVDFYRVWARLVVDGVIDSPLERKFAVGTAFLRGVGRGRVVSVTGVEEANKKVGPLVVRASLPVKGTPRSDSYEGDGYVIVRHTDTEVVKEAIKTVLETIRVNYA